MIDFWTLINKYPSESWDWDGISRNAQITWEIICANPDKSWNDSHVSQNPNITWDIIKRNPKGPFESESWKWDYGYLCANPNITLDIIDSHPEIFVNYDIMSRNPNLTWEYINNNMHRPWNWDYITCHQNITLDIMFENDHLGWELSSISKNPNLNIKFLIDNLDGFMLGRRHVEWNWFELTINPSFSNEDIVAHCDLNWHCGAEFHNPRINCDDLLSIHDDYCDIHYKIGDPNRQFWVNMSYTPNLTPWFVDKHVIEPWDVEELSCNPMGIPYYKTTHYGKKLAKRLIDAVTDELITCACHPRRHSGCWMSIDELVDHPLAHLTPEEIKREYDLNLNRKTIQ